MPADHLRIEVRLTPRASRDAVEGEKTLSDGRRVLAARVRALPENGAANDALMRLVARTCGVGIKHVSLVSGATSRLKSIRIQGDPVALATALGLGPTGSRSKA
jgi:uncharacterized protein YggU (UPF0235/DUF167 family)